MTYAYLNFREITITSKEGENRWGRNEGNTNERGLSQIVGQSMEIKETRNKDDHASPHCVCNTSQLPVVYERRTNIF